MSLFMWELVLVLVVMVLFGYMIGFFTARAKYEERYQEKIAKLTNIINEKNAAIIKIKSDLRLLQRLHENDHGREHELQQMIEKKSKEITALRERQHEIEKQNSEILKELEMIKHDKELLLKELEEKRQLLSNQDNIIVELEQKIKELTHEVK
ncbi:MAG TPA: hypothetical protein ENK93_01655 [Campylobacteraceae bacterium]|nr:hypothetical protein [Campylobacteraceae bacterium]